MRRCEMVPGPPAQIPLFGSITDVSVKPEGISIFRESIARIVLYVHLKIAINSNG